MYIRDAEYPGTVKCLFWSHAYNAMMHSLIRPQNACITTCLLSSAYLETLSTDTACVRARMVFILHTLNRFTTL